MTNTNPASTLAALVDEAKWLVGEVMDDFYRGTLREHQLLKAIDDLAHHASTPSAAPMAVGEPFGWVTTGPNGIFSKSREMLAFCQGEDVIPLYAHPPTAQVAERQPLTGWQPIETAPRDGTNVLLVNHKGNMATGMWMNSPFSIGWWLRGGIGPDAFFNDHFGPAAWQPLPTPPGIVSSSSSGEGSSNV